MEQSQAFSSFKSPETPQVFCSLRVPLFTTVLAAIVTAFLVAISVSPTVRVQVMGLNTIVHETLRPIIKVRAIQGHS